MNGGTSLLLGVIFLAPLTVSAQYEQWPEQRSNAFEDPFDLMQREFDTMQRQGSFGKAPANDPRTDVATISLQQLQHRTPKLAQAEFKKSVEAIRKGHYQSAIEHLQKAISIDTNFCDAYNDLGAIYVQGGQYEQGLLQFQKATALAPNHNLAVANLAITLYLLGRTGEVLPIARRALKIEPDNFFLHYVLGYSIFSEHGDKAEALDHLRRAVPQFPAARLAVSKVLLRMGRPDDAAQELTEYLGSTPTGDSRRQQVEEQLALLRR